MHWSTCQSWATNHSPSVICSTLAHFLGIFVSLFSHRSLPTNFRKKKLETKKHTELATGVPTESIRVMGVVGKTCQWHLSFLEVFFRGTGEHFSLYYTVTVESCHTERRRSLTLLKAGMLQLHGHLGEHWDCPTPAQILNTWNTQHLQQEWSEKFNSEFVFVKSTVLIKSCIHLHTLQLSSIVKLSLYFFLKMLFTFKVMSSAWYNVQL